MKESKYNYTVSGEKTVFFNSRTKRYFFISKNNTEQITDILHKPNLYKNRYNSFIERMKKEGFILEDEEDEYKMMMNVYRNSLHKNDYTLMIVPTYRCNLRCWYCYQDHRPQDMSEETVKRIKLHIHKYLTEHEIENFHISWFGGEPLVKFDILYDVSIYAKKECEKLGINMNCNITTNSLLLDDSKIELLNDCNVDFFQITIDGCKDEHNNVKHIPHVDTFTRALDNIVSIVKNMPKTHCILRINLSHKIHDPSELINQIDEIIPEELRYKVKVDIQTVWQEAKDESTYEKIYKVRDKAQNSKFQTTTFHQGICYVDFKHYNFIFPNGSVDICDHEGIDKVGRGKLTKNGDILWFKELQCFKYNINNLLAELI